MLWSMGSIRTEVELVCKSNSLLLDADTTTLTDFSEKDKTRAWHSRHLSPWPGRSSRCSAWGFCCRSPCLCHQASGGRTMPYAVPDSQVKCRPPPLKSTVLLLQGNTAALISIIKTTVPSKANIYAVTVENRCICTQANIKLACSGFNSSVAIDLAGVLNVDGDGKLCTLNGGHPIGMGPEYAVKFSYASPSGQFGFKPVSSSIVCS